ncbi:MAG: hypothetical protein KBS67_04260 [Bacteroidales bacterium]|nr:hypothetical protein [Candidatus Cryptobacteroides equifaecalis]
MKKLFLLLCIGISLISCTKINDTNVSARYFFEVSTPSSKAVVTGHDPLKFECEAGDEILIEVEVVDMMERIGAGGYIPQDVGMVFKSSCKLLYDGKSWNLDKDGEKTSCIEVTAKEGLTVCVKYDFWNQPEGDYEDWFMLGRRREFPLKAGDHTIVLDLSEAIGMVE